MANNDLNVNIPVGVKPNVDAGLNVVDSRFAKSRKAMETPIRSALDVDLSSVDRAQRRLQDFRKTAARLTAASAATAALSGPLNGPAVRPRFNDDEQRVRDAMAATVRGLTQRAEAEEYAGKQTKIEIEARKRLGLSVGGGRDIATKDVVLGDINGPAAKPRFTEEEAAIRAKTADLIRAMDAEARAHNLAEEAAKTEAIARRRLGLTRDPSDPDRLALRRREQSNRDGKVPALGSGDIGYTGGVNGLNSTGRSALERARQRADARAATSPRGGGGSGGRGDVLRGLANTLPGLGPAGVILLGLNAIGNAPAIAKGIRTNTQDYGTVGGLAQSAGDAIGVGGIARNIRQSIESVIAPNLAKANDRKNEAIDARRELSDKLAAKREQDNAFLSPAIAGLASGSRADRQGAALAGLRNQFDIGRTSLEQNYQNQGTGLDAQLQAGREAKLSPDAMMALEKSVAEARKAAGLKYDADLARLNEDLARDNAKVERDSKTESSDRLASLQQSIMEAEGNAFGAEIARINAESDKAVALADQRLADASRDFGAGSPQERAAQQAKTDAEAARNGAKQYLIPEAQRRAGIAANDALSRGYQAQAVFGDRDAALKAATIDIEKATVERRREIDTLIASNTLSADRVADLKKQRAELPALEQKQRHLAQQQIDEQEKARRSGVISGLVGGQADELRKQAARTGDRGLGLQADAMSIADQYRQQAESLRQQLDNPNTKGDEKTAIQAALDRLPAELSASIGDLTRANVTAGDFVSGATAQASDAGGLRGYAQGAREDIQARIARESTDQTMVLKKIAASLDAYLKGGVGAAAPVPSFDY